MPLPLFATARPQQGQINRIPTMLVDQSCLRRRFLLRAAALLGLVSGGGAIDWGETTSSTSYDPPYNASVGELITVSP